MNYESAAFEEAASLLMIVIQGLVDSWRSEGKTWEDIEPMLDDFRHEEGCRCVESIQAAWEMGV